MKKFFNVLGIITFVMTVITSTIAAGLLGFFLGLVGGIFSSAIFFGIAAILDGQEDIKYTLSTMNGLNRKQSAYDFNDKITCEKCKKQYSSDYSSCPYCGFKG